MSYPKALVNLPSPWNNNPYSVTVIGFDRCSFVKEMSAPEEGKVITKPVLWVKLRLPHPEYEQRFEILEDDVIWVNTETATAYNIGNLLPVIGIGYGAEQKMEAFRERQQKKQDECPQNNHICEDCLQNKTPDHKLAFNLATYAFLPDAEMTRKGIETLARAYLDLVKE